MMFVDEGKLVRDVACDRLEISNVGKRDELDNIRY